MLPIITLSIIYAAGSIYYGIEIYKSRKRMREEFPPGWLEELKQEYFEKHPDEKPK